MSHGMLTMTYAEFGSHLARLGIDKRALGGLIGVQVILEYMEDTVRGGGSPAGPAGQTVHFFDSQRQATILSQAMAVKCVESLPAHCGLKDFWEAVERHGGEIVPLTESLIPRPRRREMFGT